MDSGSQQETISDRARLAAMLLLLAALLVACKGTLLPLPQPTPGDALRWAVRLGVVAAADVAYATLLGLALWALGKVARRLTPRRPGWFWAVAWTAVVGSALYGAASVVIFRHLEMQLSFPMLPLFGEWREMAASVAAAVSWQAWVGLGAAAGAWWAAYRGVIWHLQRRPLRLPWAGALLLAGLLTAYLGFSLYWSGTHWQDLSLWQARLSRSPHLRLVESLVTAAPMVSSTDFPPDAPEFDDFRPCQGSSQRALGVQDSSPPAASGGTGIPNAQLPTPDSPLSPPRKNIVLVVLESVGAKWMGLYGATFDNTPYLQRLAHHALVFENVYAQCPSSAKAMVAMLCGVYPRMDWREQTDTGQVSAASLADGLRRQGYRTGFFHSGDWSWRGGDGFLKNHGFEHVSDARHLPRQACSWGQYDSWLLDQMLPWIDQSQKPFLAVAWTIQTHHPYTVEGEIRDYRVGDPELNRYLNGIRESDQLVGRLWHAIQERGLASSTVLAVIGDHGEAFGQHHQRLHIFGLYEENVHVPLVIVHDDPRLPVGRRATLGGQIDLPATLAECAGVPACPFWQGRSLLGAGGCERAYFYTVWDPVLFGVRQDRWKYVLEPGRGDALYDLAADPGERENLAPAHPELRAELKRRLHALVAYHRRRLTNAAGADKPPLQHYPDGRRLTAAGTARRQ